MHVIHVEQTFDENVFTLRGQVVHARVDEPASCIEVGVRVERSLALYSTRLGLVGKADVVEFHAGDVPYPVEYKYGPKRIKAHDNLQLAAQAICLEEMTGKAVRYGAIYHHTSRHRREVEITDDLMRAVEDTTFAIRELLHSGVLPPPVNDDRCRHCSLIDICQPAALSATNKISSLRRTLFRPEET